MDIENREQLKDIHYVSITMKSKSGGHLNSCGLFVGLDTLCTDSVSPQLVNSEDEFIWLFQGNSAHMFHLDYYNITKIGIGHGEDLFQLTPYKDETQSEAIEAIRNIMKYMADEKNLTVKGIIDIERVYKQIPPSLMTKLNLKSKTTVELDLDDTNTAKTTGTKTTTTAATTVHKPHTPVVIEIGTASIFRTTKYDAAKAITRMRKKLKALSTGTYEPPELKPLTIDIEEELELELDVEEETTNETKEVTDAQKELDAEYDAACSVGMMGMGMAGFHGLG